MASQASIVVAGAGRWAGAYLLRMEVAAPLAVSFGRFAKGHPIAIAAGGYLYVGSACGLGHAPLLARVTRHLQRTPARTPQLLGQAWQAFLTQHAAPFPAPRPKRLRWHIDFFLDEPQVTVTHIALFRSTQPIEKPFAAHLAALDSTAPLAPGLGASDHPGFTHLLRWHGSDQAWDVVLHALTCLAARD